jgi:hypothetical protein
VKRWIAAEIGVDDKFVDRFEMIRTLDIPVRTVIGGRTAKGAL